MTNLDLSQPTVLERYFVVLCGLGAACTLGRPLAARRSLSPLRLIYNKQMFGDMQMSALADMIQAALMLNYNGRTVVWAECF